MTQDACVYNLFIIKINNVLNSDIVKDGLVSLRLYKSKIQFFVFCIVLFFTFVNHNDVKNEEINQPVNMQNMDLKERLSHIIRAQNLTASQFAEKMQIQPANVSHLLSGRNKPSFEFLVKLKEVFPEYSFDWIILGKKPITINNPNPELFPSVEKENKSEVKNDNMTVNRSISAQVDMNQSVAGDVRDSVQTADFGAVAANAARISKIIVVYDDDTFKVLNNKG